MAAEFKPEQLRTIVLAGHGGSGKTTLAEAMLFAAKETTRMGRVEDGTTVSDYHPDEIERSISITLSALNVHWKSHKINILDTPGFPDFIGEVKSAVRVADSMVMCVDASTGVGFGADSAWEFATESNIPVMFVLTKVGVEQAHFEETLNYLREHFSRDIAPLEYPVYENKTLLATVDILSQKCMHFKEDGSHEDGECPAAVADRVKELRDQLIETLAESDEELMNAFFENGELTQEQIDRGLSAAVLRRRIFPLFAVQSTREIGVTPLLDFIVEHTPGPLDLPAPVVSMPGRSEAVTLENPANAEPALFVFKTVSEAHVGELSFFRVFAGKVSPGSDLLNTTTGASERLGQLFSINGKQRKEASTLHYGDIGAVVKLKNTHTNQTLSSKNTQLKVPTIWFPAPIADAAVFLKGGKGDEAKVAEGLHVLHEEDPTFNVYIDPESHQTVISGLGELHLDVILKRLEAKYGLAVETKAPRIPYRETIRSSTTTSYRHRKQTGGAGQFGEVHFYIEPWEEGRPVPAQYPVRGAEVEDLPWGGKFHFINSIVGGSIDARFVPAVKKGILETLARGAYAGYPVTNVRVVLFDGKMHPVDSNENAFKTAARMCFKQGFRECKPQLMEPIWVVEISAPVEYMGDIMGDLSSRRGRILGMDTKGSMQVIRAQVPLGDLYGYAARLRSLTQGRGSYTRTFDHYEEVPKDVEAKIVAGAELAEVEE